MSNKTIESLRCPSCGAPLPPGSADRFFCPYCGSTVVVSDRPSRPEAGPAPVASPAPPVPSGVQGLSIGEINRLISAEKKKQAAIRKEIAQIKGSAPSTKVAPIRWSLNDLPDLYSLTSDQLVWLRKDAEKKLETLETKEPDPDDEIRFEKWLDKHDELQDFLDELEDRIEEQYEDELDI